MEMMQPALGVCVCVESCLPLVYKMKFHLPLMKLFVFMSGRQPEEEKRNVHHLRPLLAAWTTMWRRDVGFEMTMITPLVIVLKAFRNLAVCEYESSPSIQNNTWDTHTHSNVRHHAAHFDVGTSRLQRERVQIQQNYKNTLCSALCYLCLLYSI